MTSRPASGEFANSPENASALRESAGAEVREPSPSPYAAPTSESLSPEAKAAALAPRVRVPPMLAILMCQTPYYAVVGVVFLQEAVTKDGSQSVLTALFLAAALDLCLYNVRTLFIGPGGIFARVTAALSLTACAGFLPDAIGLFDDSSESEPRILGDITTMAMASLPAGALGYAFGSRERGLRGEVVCSRFDWPITATCVIAALAFIALEAFGPRAAATIESFRAVADRPYAVWLAAGTILGMVPLFWRFVLRGLRLEKGWALWFVGVGILSLMTLFALIAVLSTHATEPLGAPTMLFAFVFLLPIARELFLRFAGYRAVNVWAKRRREAREKAAAVEAASET